jgi:hypothetical protein
LGRAAASEVEPEIGQLEPVCRHAHLPTTGTCHAYVGPVIDTERVYAVEVGAGVVSATSDASTYNHYGLLAGLYAAFCLGTARRTPQTRSYVPFPAGSRHATNGHPVH